MTALAYIVRPGDRNPELRYSLRSVWWHLPHTEVWIAGHAPAWVRGVHVIGVAQNDDKRRNALANLRALVEQGPDEFILMNDDFFALRAILSPPAPVFRGPLREQVGTRRRGSPHAETLRLTDSILREAGIAEPLSYETHTPMTMTREGLQMALDYGARHAVGESFAPRSIYGNLLHVGGQRIGNVKVYASEPAPRAAVDWVSTTDTSFRYHAIGERLRAQFPEASPYEAS